MQVEPIAHTRNALGKQHALTAHLLDVAELASGFAENFGAADTASYLGLCHDLGKFHPTSNATSPTAKQTLPNAVTGRITRRQAPVSPPGRPASLLSSFKVIMGACGHPASSSSGWKAVFPPRP